MRGVHHWPGLQMTAAMIEADTRNANRATHIANIRKLRDSLCEPLTHIEWRNLPAAMKVVIVLMAGLDEGHETKGFAEFTPPEKEAIKLQIRSMKRNLAPLIALSGW